ncbi:unnamed protein product [Amoebophrya sp. A120]|nr:unnamed protein product [Amoebophrya sp. A120]|eukprot:GSA120T00004133001.1
MAFGIPSIRGGFENMLSSAGYLCRAVALLTLLDHLVAPLAVPSFFVTGAMMTPPVFGAADQERPATRPRSSSDGAVLGLVGSTTSEGETVVTRSSTLVGDVKWAVEKALQWNDVELALQPHYDFDPASSEKNPAETPRPENDPAWMHLLQDDGETLFAAFRDFGLLTEEQNRDRNMQAIFNLETPTIVCRHDALDEDAASVHDDLKVCERKVSLSALVRKMKPSSSCEANFCAPSAKDFGAIRLWARQVFLVSTASWTSPRTADKLLYGVMMRADAGRSSASQPHRRGEHSDIRNHAPEPPALRLAARLLKVILVSKSLRRQLDEAKRVRSLGSSCAGRSAVATSMVTPQEAVTFADCRPPVIDEEAAAAQNQNAWRNKPAHSYGEINLRQSSDQEASGSSFSRRTSCMTSDYEDRMADRGVSDPLVVEQGLYEQASCCRGEVSCAWKASPAHLRAVGVSPSRQDPAAALPLSARRHFLQQAELHSPDGSDSPPASFSRSAAESSASIKNWFFRQITCDSGKTCAGSTNSQPCSCSPTTVSPTSSNRKEAEQQQGGAEVTPASTATSSGIGREGSVATEVDPFELVVQKDPPKGLGASMSSDSASGAVANLGKEQPNPLAQFTETFLSPLLVDGTLLMRLMEDLQGGSGRDAVGFSSNDESRGLLLVRFCDQLFSWVQREVTNVNVVRAAMQEAQKSGLLRRVRHTVFNTGGVVEFEHDQVQGTSHRLLRSEAAEEELPGIPDLDQTYRQLYAAYFSQRNDQERRGQKASGGARDACRHGPAGSKATMTGGQVCSTKSSTTRTLQQGTSAPPVPNRISGGDWSCLTAGERRQILRENPQALQNFYSAGITEDCVECWNDCCFPFLSFIFAAFCQGGASGVVFDHRNVAGGSSRTLLNRSAGSNGSQIGTKMKKASTAHQPRAYKKNGNTNPISLAKPQRGRTGEEASASATSSSTTENEESSTDGTAQSLNDKQVQQQENYLQQQRTVSAKTYVVAYLLVFQFCFRLLLHHVDYSPEHLRTTRLLLRRLRRIYVKNTDPENASPVTKDQARATSPLAATSEAKSASARSGRRPFSSTDEDSSSDPDADASDARRPCEPGNFECLNLSSESVTMLMPPKTFFSNLSANREFEEIFGLLQSALGQ